MKKLLILLILLIINSNNAFAFKAKKIGFIGSVPVKNFVNWVKKHPECEILSVNLRPSKKDTLFVFYIVEDSKECE